MSIYTEANTNTVVEVTHHVVCMFSVSQSVVLLHVANVCQTRSISTMQTFKYTRYMQARPAPPPPPPLWFFFVLLVSPAASHVHDNTPTTLWKFWGEMFEVPPLSNFFRAGAAVARHFAPPPPPKQTPWSRPCVHVLEITHNLSYSVLAMQCWECKLPNANVWQLLLTFTLFGVTCSAESATKHCTWNLHWH